MSFITHRVKILYRFAVKNRDGLKPWEIRKNDRNYKVGDIILFEIIDDKTKKPTGYVYNRKITYLYEGTKYGLKKGYCIMTLE